MAFENKEQAKTFFDNKVAKQINILMYSLGDRSNLTGDKLKDLNSLDLKPSVWFEKHTTIYYIPTAKGHVAFSRINGEIESVYVFERDKDGYNRNTIKLDRQAVDQAITAELGKLKQSKGQAR